MVNGHLYDFTSDVNGNGNINWMNAREAGDRNR